MKYLKNVIFISIFTIFGIIFLVFNTTAVYAANNFSGASSPFINSELVSEKNPILNNNFGLSNDADSMTSYDNEDTYQEIQDIKNKGTKAVVTNANELVAALKNTDVSYIQLGANILMSNSARSGYQDLNSMYGLTKGQIKPHDFVIDGDNNKYTLEGRTGTDYPEINLDNSYYGKVVLNNINLCGTDYYGPVTTRDQNDESKYSKTQLIYRNINYTGAQLTASYYAQVIFTGKNTVYTNSRYYVGINPNTYERDYTVGYNKSVDGKNPDLPNTNYPFQENIEASSVIFDKNTYYDGKSGGQYYSSDGNNSFASNSGCFALGKWYNYDGRADVMDNANVTLTTSGDRYGWSNKATLIVNGTLEVHPGAILNVNTDNIKPIYGYSYSRDNHYNGIVLDNMNGVKSNLLIDKNATLNDNMKGPTDSRRNNNNPGVANGGTLAIGSNAKVDVGQYGKLNISSTENTYRTAPVIDGSPNSIFHVNQYGQFSLKYESDGTVNDFDTDANGLMFMGSDSIFTFERASSVNIEDDTKSYTQKKLPLIYSPKASLNVSAQNLYTWNNGNLNWGSEGNPWEEIDNPDAEYPAMFNMISKYNGGYVSSTGSSTNQNVAEKFESSFNTDKLQRIQYNYIPSVKIASLKQMTDNPNSVTISGHVETNDGYDISKTDLPLEGALIRIKGHVKHTNSNAYWTSDNQYTSATVDADQPIPKATISSPVSGNSSSDGNDYTSNFNSKTDSNGDFIITLPKSLMASDSTDTSNSDPNENGRIQVFAFKDGNYDNNSYAVDDVISPKVVAYSEKDARVVQVNHPITDPKSFIKSYSDFSSDTNSNIWNKDVSFSFDDSKNPSDLWTSPGTDKTVYIKATDDSGNVTEVESYVDVYSNNSYIICNDSPVSMDLPKVDEKPSDWNTWAISENDVKAYTINNDGLGKTTDVSDLVTSNASESIYKKGSHTITYTLPSQYDAKPVEGIIIFKGTVLSLSLEGTDPLSFGPIQALDRNKDIKPKNKVYGILVNGVDDDNKNGITLTAQADDFQLDSSQINPSDLDLGIVNNGVFSSLLNGPIPLTKPSTISNGTYNYDLLNGNNKIILQNKGLSYPGIYKTVITWTLSDTIK